MIESIQVDQLGVPVRAFLSSRRPPRAPRTVAEKRQATAHADGLSGLRARLRPIVGARRRRHPAIDSQSPRGLAGSGYRAQRGEEEI
jgi:hypothetical protein